MQIHKWLIIFILFTLFSAGKGISAGRNSCFLEDKHSGISSTEDTTGAKKRIYYASRINSVPVINGRLDDSCWTLGEWQSNYTQFTPVYKAAPSRKTDLKILYDDKNIYVGIRAFDNMAEMTKRLSRRDNFAGDLVGVHFDSYFDRRTAFEFDITSAGQKLDLWVANDGWDINWNAVWTGKVAYEDSAWTAEFKIPLSQLRFGSSEEQVWGLNAWRMIDRLQEEDHWNLVANDGTGIVYTFGELHGLKGLKEGRRFELTPYVSGKMTTDKTAAGNPFIKSKGFKGLGGLDVKLGITNNFTLDATINPDFGQVEADPSVMNLSAFETYFEEKRPFFIEGKNIFDFDFDNDLLFYSRRIGHAPSYTPAFSTFSMPENTAIGGAFKLSGKTQDGLSLGFIESVAMKEMADIHENNSDFRQAVEPLTNYFIGRFQKDYDKGSTIIGGIVTNTHRVISEEYLNFLSRDASTGGIDFTRYWDDRKYFLEVKAVGSSINGDKNAISRLQTSSARYFQRPDIKGTRFDSTRTVLGGYGASVKFGKWSKGNWRYNEEFIMRSPGLELNDLGYMTTSNIMKNNINVSYHEIENAWIFKTYTFSMLQQNAWNAHGGGLYSLVSLEAESEFMNGWALHLGGEYKFRTVDEQLLRGGPAMKIPDMLEYSWWLHSNSSRDLYFSLSGDYGNGLQGSSDYFSIASEITYRPSSNLAFSVQPSYLKSVDELQYIGQFDRTASDKVYLLGKVDNRNLGITFRIDLALTPELTLQYYGSPFVSIGKYSDFKEVLNPLDPEYSNRFNILHPGKPGQTYSFDSDKDGIADYSFTNPDFNYQQFKSNLVLRWEYMAGSTLYLVWAQDRTAFEQNGPFNFDKGFRSLSRLFPRNIVMVKFNYWFST